MNKQKNLENFKKIVSQKKSVLLEKLKWEKENEQWLDQSFQIALKVVRAMRKQNLNQKDLAERMQVSPQYISKMLKGKENLSLQTISKLEKVLDIKMITILESEENPISFEEFDMNQVLKMKDLTESISYPRLQILNIDQTSGNKNYQLMTSKFLTYPIKGKDEPSSFYEEEVELCYIA